MAKTPAAVALVRDEQAELSPERAALAEAHVAVAKARKAVDVAKAAEARQAARVAEAEREAQAAELAIADVRSGHLAAMAAAAIAGTAAGPSAELRAARARLTDALDALDDSREVHATLRDATNSAHQALHNAKLEIAPAERGVILPAMDALRAEIERESNGIIGKRLELAFLVQQLRARNPDDRGSSHHRTPEENAAIGLLRLTDRLPDGSDVFFPAGRRSRWL